MPAIRRVTRHPGKETTGVAVPHRSPPPSSRRRTSVGEVSRHRDTSTQTGPGSGRGRSIRASLITLAVVPATAMVLLWVSGSFALFDQWNNANQEGQPAKTTYALVPAIGEFQKERQLTVGLL